jgi:hypothetical protein
MKRDLRRDTDLYVVVGIFLLWAFAWAFAFAKTASVWFWPLAIALLAAAVVEVLVGGMTLKRRVRDKE